MRNLFVLSGPSGCGKNTVYEALRQKMPSLAQTVSATTRPARSGEMDGVDYYFLSTREFEEKIAEDAFVEYVRYGENYYGTLKSEIVRLTEAGNTILLIIEVRGALRFKKLFPEAVSIFLLPPSEDALRRRILKRGQNTPEEVEARLTIAMQELSLKDQYDYNVINDDLDRCVEEVYAIITDEKE
ncbi:MAG: guanylate kinase [Clostridia bacterium]|nr:guanylate kinase [Clostridia bacterium]